MISIVDYGSGNIQAIKNIYKRLNIECQIVSTAEQLAGATKIILAGVGSFDETMKLLEQSGMRKMLDKLVIEDNVPVLGVCVGMQIMATSSDEGQLSGLNWFDAKVRMFDESLIQQKPKTPHMGWNTAPPTNDNEIFKGVDEEKGFYFLHSFYFECKNESDILAKTLYGQEFTSAVQKGNIYGFQFHPEKSHSNGINVFKNFAELNLC